MSLAAREACLAAIQRALLACTAANAAEDIDAVEAAVRLDLIEGYWARLLECHYDVIGALEDDAARVANERYIANAEEVFTQAKANLRRLAAVQPAIAAGGHAAGNANQIDLLPERCKIETFYGNYAKWQEFRDMFRSLVHARQISNVQKLQLLKSAVKGNAASVLGSWQMSGDNYEPAWQALVDVYDDEYLIIKAHLDRLFDLPNIGDVYDELRTAIDTTNETVRSLQVLGVAVQHWDTIIVYMLESRLRQSLKEAWDLRRPIAGLPNLRDMLTFLSARARAKANIPKGVSSTVRARTTTQLSESSESSKSSRPAKQVRKEAPCPLCKASHGLYRCSDFLSLSLRAREDKVHAWRLCGNCLNAGHRASECKRGDCRTCQKPHNSVLCPVRAERSPAVASVVVRVQDGSAAESSE